IPKSDSTKYQHWLTYTYKNINIHYPPKHPLEDNIKDLPPKYITSIKQNCRLLNIDVPKETLDIYFYSGLGQGQEMTGQQYPYAEKNTIHFWLPAYYGTTIMKYLIPKWQKDEPQFQFLKHGLLALLDNAGKNYHITTLDYVNNGKIIPLSQLVVDTSINCERERYQSAFAASFVDFILFYYSIEALNLLYTSQLNFETTVKRVFNISVDSLQNLWLNTVKEVVVEKEK
ncbi:MAG: hypothetical protein ACE5D6_05960, partial [Candidatus Zixiibacteriota bacterium]